MARKLRVSGDLILRTGQDSANDSRIPLSDQNRKDSDSTVKSSRRETYVTHESRLAGYSDISTTLSLLNNQQIRELVENATALGNGIGGSTALLQLENTFVFVKRIPITELEKSVENFMSTRNVFELPSFFHYGIGSLGHGVWREVAAHKMTTNWVLAKRSESFPLLYHWRVLPNLKQNTSEEVSDLVEFWGAKAVQDRIEAIEHAVDCVVLFLEYIPYSLHDWLTEQVALGEDTASSAFAKVESDLRNAVSFMNANDLLHFDAHFRNILTDGNRLYISDFGLAASTRFELSNSEIEFYKMNKAHDECYVVTEFVNWLIRILGGVNSHIEIMDYIRRCINGEKSRDLTGSAAVIIERYAPIALVMNEFYSNLISVNRSTPFPVEEIQQVSAMIGFDNL